MRLALALALCPLLFAATLPKFMTDRFHGPNVHVREVEGVQVAGLIREQVPLADGTITPNRVSLRSRGGVDVSQIARKSRGGGHKQAAGFSHPGSVKEIRDFIVAEVGEQLSESAA